VKPAKSRAFVVVMAPKGKDTGKASSGGKGKSKGGKDEDVSSAGGSGKLKAAQSINVRHILVGASLTLCLKRTRSRIRGHFDFILWQDDLISCLICRSVRNTRRRKKRWQSCERAPNSMMSPENSAKIRLDKVGTVTTCQWWTLAVALHQQSAISVPSDRLT
jgi:hypothetical protein